MRPRRNRALASGIALTLALPALAQDQPRSLLPPGFGDQPANTPAPRPSPDAPAAPDSGEGVPTITLTPQDLGAAPIEAAAATPDEAKPEEQLDVPEAARRATARVGLADGSPEGYGADAFGQADGRFLSVLMRSLDAPIASRWLSIALRRALVSRTETPPGIADTDWIAERAWLLLRMGEADAARMLIDQVDVDQYTPKLLAVATQAALATADPAALCPLAAPAATMSTEPAWPLARAMCAALSGQAGLAQSLVAQAKARKAAKGIDLLLAEKVIGAGANGRRSVQIRWEPVTQLTSWRFGLATALGVPVPADLMRTVGPHVAAWAARAPMIAPDARIGPARAAAALGVFSNAALVDLYGAVADRTDPAALGTTPPGQLRAAYVGDNGEARIAALRALWGDGSAGPLDRYAAQILTARAAARLRPNAALAADCDLLVGAMMTAGLDHSADRWSAVVTQAGGGADRAWSILAVGSPAPTVPIDVRRVSEFGQRAGTARARMLLAALGALGRLPAQSVAELGAPLGLGQGGGDAWSRTIDRAAARGEQGTVLLLAAAAMQARDWRAISAVQFGRMIAALETVGLDGEARMIAAEAMTRL